MRAGLTGEFDEALEAEARALAALTSEEDGRFELDFDPAIMPSFSRAQNPDYFELWFPEGKPWLSRPEGKHLPNIAGALDKPTWTNLTLSDGHAGRAVG